MNRAPHKESRFQAIAFVAFLAFSVAYFTYALFTPRYFLSPYDWVRNQDIIGIIFLFWSGLMISRILWMLEINISFQAFGKACRSGKNLPQRLLDDLSYRHMVQNAARSWKALNMLSFIWLMLGILFIIWGIIVVKNPISHEILIHLQEEIQSFLQTQNTAEEPIHLAHLSFLLVQIVKIFMIGIVFWLAQSFSYGYRNTTPILWGCLVLFGLSFLFYATTNPMLSDISKDLNLYSNNLWHGYGWLNIPVMTMMDIVPQSELSPLQNRLIATGIPSVVILYSLGVLAFLTLMQGFERKRDNKGYALIGSGVLLLMGFCDIFLVQKSGVYGVWLSGWACVAILWVKSGSQAKKRYRIFLK